MKETLLHHLERRSPEDVLPGLIEKTLERGWRAVIRCESAERGGRSMALLWTYDDASFLPHAQQGDGDSAKQPVLVTVEEGNANAANVMFFVGGANPTAWHAVNDLTRVVLMFDGRDAQMLGAARASWKDAKAAGHDVTYWKEMPSGKFEKQA